MLRRAFQEIQRIIAMNDRSSERSEISRLSRLRNLHPRRLEAAFIFQPAPYKPGPKWEMPAGVDEIWMEGKDNVRLHAWLYRARYQRSRGTILFCHGRAVDLTKGRALADYFSLHGFDVLVFDYRGFGRSSGEITAESDLYADAETAYDYLIGQLNVSPEDLVIYGHSLGTAAAVDLASRRKCSALVLEAGLSSAQEMGMVVASWVPAWLRKLGRNSLDSVRKLSTIRTPVMIAHGTNDVTIPIEQGLSLYAAAQNPKRLMVAANGSHSLVDSLGINYLSEVLRFIDAQLMPQRAADQSTSDPYKTAEFAFASYPSTLDPYKTAEFAFAS